MQKNTKKTQNLKGFFFRKPRVKRRSFSVFEVLKKKLFGKKLNRKLKQKSFLTIFDHLSKTEQRFEKDFGSFLDAYKFDKDILGTEYFLARKFSSFNRILHKIFNFFWKATRKTVVRLAILFLITSVVYFATPFTGAAPRSHSVSTQTEWEAGEINDLSTTSSLDSLQLASDGTWNARSWAPAPDTISFGSTSILVGNYLYVARGYSDDDMYVYNIELNEWEDTINLPQPVHYGSDVAYDGNGNLYFIFGGYSKEFYRYNIENDDWTELPELLDTSYLGSSIAFDGTDLYIARGGNTTDFWRFDISENSWYNMAPTPATFYTGADLVYGENGKIYSSRGYNRQDFYEYDIATNNWTSLASSPQRFNGEKEGVYYNGHVYYLRSGNTANFYRYDIASNNWDTLPDTPANVNYGSINYNSDDGLMYVIRANGQYTLWKFDPDAAASGEWVGPPYVPATVNTGGDLIWNGITGAGGYVYAVRGSSNAFYRYDLTNNSWSTMSSASANMSYDTKGTYFSGYIYMHRGDNTTTSFYRYDVAGDSWSTMAAAPDRVRYGSSSVYVQDSGTDYVFMTRGNAQDDLYRYDISGDSWSAMADIVDGDGTSYRCYYGCRMESDGTDLYLMPGDGETAFLKYDVSADSWSQLARSPFSQRLGTDMTHRSGKIYALAGSYKDETWEYDIAGDSWRKLPSNQRYTYGRGPSNGASIVYAGGDSFYASPGTAITDFWSFTLGSSNFVLSGTYVSDTIDLSYVDSWVSLTGTEDTPTNTSISYETRTSNDGENWSSWAALSGSNIQSPERRYFQVRATLASVDGANTPTLSDITISYNSEDIDPNNPDTISAYSQEIGGDVLVSGTAYKHAHPYFSWSGATDPDSGIEGYYVYFGTNNSADPETDGVFQAGSTYTVNLAMQTGNHYLRIKTQDYDSNISNSAWEAFTYNYDGVSPYQSLTKTTQAEFELGTVDNVSTSNDPDELQLESSSDGGFWDEVRLSNTPGSIRYGSELAQADGDIYALRGNNQTTFYFYDVSEDTWSTLAATPASVYYGGSLVEGPDGYLYAARGYNSSTFWRYDIGDDSWSVVASAPKNFTYGSSLSYDDSRYIYGLPGNDDAFYRYDTQNNQWTTMPNAEFGNPNEVDGQRTYRGSDSAYDGTNAIYVMQGNYYNYFAKYTIDDNAERGESANEWVVLESLPVGPYTGGNMSYDPETNSVFVLTGNYRQNFFKYDVTTDEWTQMPDVPASIEYGASMTVIDGYIYATRGYNSTLFYRFNIEELSWDIPTQGLFGPTTTTGTSYFEYNYGAQLAADGLGNVYVTRGYYSDDFGVFDTETGEFTRLARTPVGVYNGSAMVYNDDEGVLYLTSGDLRTRKSGTVNNYFMKYTTSTNSWEFIDSDPVPYQTGYGSSIAYDGSRYIYLTRGANTNWWWRYDTQGTAGSRWSATLPTTSGWVQGYGSQLLFKQVGANNYIYTARANNTNTFFRYDVDAGTWLQLTNVPGTVRYGATLADGNDGYLYLTRGNNTDDFYRYNISGNSWETIDDVPGQIYTGGHGVIENNRLWTVPGQGTNTYQDGLYSYLVTSEANDVGYEKTGSYTSESIDLTDVYRWANLTITFDQPANTHLTISTRSSADASDWSSWDVVTEQKDLGSDQYRYNIQSPANRYIQVQVEFVSGGQVLSPKVEDFTINYYQDLNAPANPSTVNAYDTNAMATTLTTNNWYNHTAPYFTWPAAEAAGGATDGVGGSGVVGYYVYFGTNASADPYVDGAYQTELTYEAAGLTSGQDYYLLIKAVDDAQMVPATSFNAFTYRFDSTPPTNPSNILVDPAGYTASDVYDFLWDSDVADAESGVSMFQYRTGGDAVDVWIDIADPGTITLTIPNVDHVDAAYQTGKNWFYLRAVDNAGNFSDPLDQEYYFSSDAPSPPQNLAVTPDTSETNAFAFTWERPESFTGNASEITYHYSVNALPNAFNTVETPITAAGPGPFATQRGANRFYVCAMDEAGNIDYDLHAYVDFYADTSAPGAPVNVQIFDTSDRENEEYSIALKWSPPESMNEDNFAGYVIYRSDDNSVFTEVATTSGSAYVDTELESRMYYYYIKSKDSTNNISIASTTSNIVPTGRYTTPPNLVTDPSFTVKAYESTISWGTDRIASSFVEYGKSMSLGKTNGQVDSVTDHEVELSGLDAGEKYYYRVKFIDPDGNIGTSEIETFETLPPPTISDVEVIEIGLNTATVSWTTNTSAECTLRYGVDTYSGSIEETSSGGGHVVRMADLSSSTTYRVQIECIDDDLNDFNSDEYNFTTLEQPIVADLVLENKENVDLPTVVIRYTTSLPTTTLVKYKTGAEGNYQNYLTNEYVTEHVAEIENLVPSVEYEIIASGVNEFGVEAVVQTAKIVTRSDSRAPGIITNRAVGRVIGRGRDARANMYIKIETDEATSAKAFYGQGVVLSNFDQSSGLNPLNTYHLITIPVDSGQVYSYIVKTFDEAGNETTTRPITVVIENTKQSALEIIVNTFSNKFSWMSETWN